MTNQSTAAKAELNRLNDLDNREYQAKFLLEPDIDSSEDFNHLDKNLAITNLKHNPKLHIDEVGEARSILRGLHILNNTEHYHEETTRIITGHIKEEKDGKVFATPVYEDKKISKSNFPKTFHSLRSEFISMVNATAARNGHRMKSAITNRLEKTESIQQQTTAQSKWGFSKNK